MTFRQPISLGPLADPQRSQVLRACGLLCRGELTDAQAEAARRLFTEPGWQPIPPIPCLFFVRPFLVHHAVRLGVGPGRLLAEPPTDVHAYFEHLAALHYKRWSALLEALEALAREAVGPVALIQGTALKPHFRSPALRLAVDFDLVVREEAVERARRALAAAGWQTTSSNLLHPATGANIDLHVPGSELGRWLWERKRPHRAFAAEWQIFEPEPAPHLVYLAAHTAKHMGDRLWRDLADFSVLLENGARRDVAEEALAEASRRGLAPQLAALLRLMNRWAMPAEPMPERPPQAWSPQQQAQAERHARLYEEMAVEQLTPVGLDLLESVRGVSLRRLWSVGRNLVLGHHDAGAIPALEAARTVGDGIRRDPLLGELPPPGSRALQALKWRLLQQALRSRQALRYWRLIGERRAIRRDQEDFRGVRGK